MPKGTILFAENTWENRKKWLLLLTEEDYEVLQTGDLSSALRLLRVCPPQLVIAPMNLPDGDAFSFVGHLRGIREFAEIPFLCLSDNLSTERQMLLQKAGVTGFFDQTESPSRFLELVKEQIQLHLPGFQEGPQGITGNLAKLSIHDLLLQLAQRHGSGKISIDGNREMSIYLNEGQVVHARHGITVGKKALFRCLHIAEATYHFQRSIPAIQPTIGESSLSELIREATLSNQKLMTGMHK
jgi:DNA-binding response OmpR family regulator